MPCPYPLLCNRAAGNPGHGERSRPVAVAFARGRKT